MYDDIFYTEEIIVKGKYGDMLNMPHHQSARHRPMPLADRAMQFGAFAAVAGHDDAVSRASYRLNWMPKPYMMMNGIDELQG